MLKFFSYLLLPRKYWHYHSIITLGATYNNPRDFCSTQSDIRHRQDSVWTVLAYNYLPIYNIIINKLSPRWGIFALQTKGDYLRNKGKQLQCQECVQLIFTPVNLSGSDKSMLTVLFQYRNTSLEQILARIYLIYSDNDLWESPGEHQFRPGMKNYLFLRTGKSKRTDEKIFTVLRDKLVTQVR